MLFQKTTMVGQVHNHVQNEQVDKCRATNYAGYSGDATQTQGTLIISKYFEGAYQRSRPSKYWMVFSPQHHGR